MEGEKRDQKLKAGKEKLAQYQRKKKKKKPLKEESNSSLSNVCQQATTTSPPLDSLADPQFFLDSDSLSISSCSEDDMDSGQEFSSRAQLHLKSKLLEKSQRVEELEESLVGKQLALDKVIKENEKLKNLIQDVNHTEQSDANHNPVEYIVKNPDQAINGSGIVEDMTRETSSENGAGSQEFTISDVQELMHHVQWLQLQLKQANNTLQNQNEKQKETAGALRHAKDEIHTLQNSITQKDKLLNELVEKMKLISTEYGLLKQNYAQLSDSSNDNFSKEVEKERKKREEIETAFKCKLEEVKSEQECKVKELVESHEERTAIVIEQYKTRIMELESELDEARVKFEDSELSLEKMTNENTGLQAYCDTLTKGLEFLKEEHEKSVCELNELSEGFKILKSEYDNLVTEKGLSDTQAESLKTELDSVKFERDNMVVEIDKLKKKNEEFQKDIENINEMFETVKLEQGKLFQDNKVLTDEVVKLKGDNATYQSQIAQYEGRLSESEEILDENHSLHVQNDELNNKINNQKDTIAALKNELEVLSLENTQYVGQMEELSTTLQQVKKENVDLNGKNEDLLKEVTDLKVKFLLLEEENLKYSESHLVLNEEIQNLRQCLAESVSEPAAKVPLQVANVKAVDVPFDSDKDILKVDLVKDSEIVKEEIIIAQETIPQNKVIPHMFTSPKDDNCDETDKDKYSYLGSKEGNEKHSDNLASNETKIEEYEKKIEHLNTMIIEIQASQFSKEVVNRALQTLQSDLPSETSDDINKISVNKNIDDTAYESLFGDHVHEEPVYTNPDLDVLTERLQNVQKEFNNVNQMLQHKTKECEELHLELLNVKQKLMQYKPEELDGDGGVFNDSDKTETVSELPKVSETRSVTCLEKEVNMHASSSLCSVPTDGVVNIDTSLSGIIYKGDSDCYVDQDTFQNDTDGRFDASSHEQQKVFSEMATNESETDNGNYESLLKELADIKRQMKIKDIEIVTCKDELKEMKIKNSDLITSIENSIKDQELNRAERESKDEIIDKLRKDQENLETVCLQWQEKTKYVEKILSDREEQLKELTYENEKLSWEKVEMDQSLTDLEKKILEMKATKCDIEFQKAQYEEELNRVKERLEYLESSDIDIVEIKDMLEKVQDQKENIMRENENLNGSVSAVIEENEKLLETVECLQKEKSLYQEKCKVSSIELKDTSNKLAERISAVNNLEEKLKILSSDMQSQNVRFENEIEGLLEENSTLKTNVQMKIDECEKLTKDNERLQSFFPNIDEATENNNLLKTKVKELEENVQELKDENEHLVAELMESQNKVVEGAEENELLLDKCEEFQRIIGELDDEKTLLIEEGERNKLETSAKLQESCALIEKYENQLESLDQENSTLKTQILSLEQEREEDQIKADHLENKEKIHDLEQDLLSLAEQIKQYEDTIAEKEDISLRLEAHIEEIMKENAQLTDKCTSIETDYLELKEREGYLIEQMKIYESAVNSEEEGSRQEIKILSGRLELESKYKVKFEKDLEQSQIYNAELERENKEVEERNVFLEKELKHAVDSKTESEKIKEKITFELERSLHEKEKIMKEKDDLRKFCNEISKSNEVLTSEIGTLQHHLQAISDNRTHIRHQVEILAAEVENLNDTNNSIHAHARELKILQCFKSEECNVLEEKKSFLTKENEVLKSQIELLHKEMEGDHENDTSLERGVHKHRSEMESELIRLKSENESLVDEIDKLHRKLNESKIIIEVLNENTVKNEILRVENEDLQQQNDELKGHFKSLNEKLTQLDELIEKNKTAELDNDALCKRLDGLQKRIVEIQKEKQALQTMTEDLTNMLHDMQTKYEEVKSEMESTKKKCDKEINHLQNQLHEMNEDVSELRKMLDYMENEVYSHAEEKTILKENLEQQQTQFVEVCEQKQKLEEILSEKQQKDLKNMQMASQRQKNTSLNTSRTESDLSCSLQVSLDGDADYREQTLPCNDQTTAEIQTTDEMRTHSESQENIALPLEEVLRDSIDSDVSDIIPSFESAFHLFGLASSDESAYSSRLVQTNITISGCNSIGFLLDDNGETTENVKEFVKKDNQTQTEVAQTVDGLTQKVFPNIDIAGNDDTEMALKPGFEIRSLDKEVCTSDLATGNNSFLPYNQDNFRGNKLQGTAFSNTDDAASVSRREHAETEIALSTSHSDENTFNTCDKSIQIGFEIVSVSCQTDTQKIQNPRLFSLDINNEDTLETYPANFSMLSADSGILSACPGADGKSLPFHYPDSNSVKSIEDLDAEFKDDDHVDDIVVKKSELLEVSSQTDLDIEADSLAEVKEQLKTEFSKRSAELEAEIENRLLTNLEFREKKVQLLEESYDKKVKQMEFDIEEKYENKFRMREVEIVFEAERNIEAQAAKVKNAAEIEIEKIKREKDKQFVETLQKVKADLIKQHNGKSGDMRRIVSYDSSLQQREQEVGPEGDAFEMPDGTFQKFSEDNEEIALERDTLLKQIKVSQAEQAVFCQDLQSIMGENGNLANDIQPKHDKDQSWLDWDLHPELSFGSMRSSLDTKSLSGSLDPSSFCSNSDCLNVRMKYEHLVDRIQVFLNSRLPVEKSDEADLVKANPDDDEIDKRCVNIEDSDRFEENNESGSQMLHRITSIDLETFVRVPKTADSKSGDQFVYEADDISENTISTVELNKDVIDRLVRGNATNLENDDYNVEGRFSENEDTDDENEGDIIDSTGVHKVNLSRNSVSFAEEGGLFCQEVEPVEVLRKKRHFSDSDIRSDEISVKMPTSQSVNNEGRFVLERLDSQVEKENFEKEDICSDQSCENKDVHEIGVFEEIEVRNISTLSSSSNSINRNRKLYLKKPEKEVDKFIDENNDNQPPGSQEVVMSASCELRTGEETGDFFEEAKSVSPRPQHRKTEQNHESDLTSVKDYKNGQQSYENTVFDILNSICPGTDPGRRPFASVVTEDTFHPVKNEFVDTAYENDEMSGSVESKLQILKASMSNMKQELRSLTVENKKLKETVKLIEKERQNDIDVLVEKVNELEETNRETILKMEHTERNLINYEHATEKSKDLEQANENLYIDLEKCKELLLRYESDLKILQDDHEELKRAEIELECEKSESARLKAKCVEMEAKCDMLMQQNNEIDMKNCEILANNSKLLSDSQMIKDLHKELEKEKSKLLEENDILKSKCKTSAVLLEKDELEKEIIEIQNKKKILESELSKKANEFLTEKTELENSLISQADMFDRKDKENKKLKEHLDTITSKYEILNKRLESENTQNKHLKDDLEREISLKMELETQKELMSAEIAELKQKLDIGSPSLNNEIEKLKEIIEESRSEIDTLKQEKVDLDIFIQKTNIHIEEKDNQLEENEKTITNLNQLNQNLSKQKEKLQDNITSLQSLVDDLKAKIDEKTNENEDRNYYNKEIRELKETNECLRNELLESKEQYKEYESANESLRNELARAKEVNKENEWALCELSKQVEDFEKEKTKVDDFEESPTVDSNKDGSDKGSNLLPQEKGSKDDFTNTDTSYGDEITTLKETIQILRNENEKLTHNVTKELHEEVTKELHEETFKKENDYREIESENLEHSVDNIKRELEALKLENETLKRSLDFAMVKDESDTDLQIFEDMKDAIKSMEAERTSVEMHERQMSDNLEQENKRLRDEVEDLYTENDELKKKLKVQEESARKENGEILKMYSDLRNEVEILVISKHDLEVELHALKDLLEHDANPVLESSGHDVSRELTFEDLQEMEELKTSIEKLKSDLKEKDTYVKKLEEHLLNIDGNIADLNLTPKPSLSRGTPLMSKSYLRRGHNWPSSIRRRAYSHDIPNIQIDKDVTSNKPDIERSVTMDTSLHVDDLEGSRNSERSFRQGLGAKEKLTSSTLTDSLGRSSFRGSVGDSERIRSGLKPDEDGHLALELKQFELVAEITKLRRDFRETKALYSKETALLTEALEKEKLANELRGVPDLSLEHSVGSNLSHDVLKLRKEVARLREQNRILSLDCDMWVEKLKEQEQIVADMKERISQNTSGYGEIEEVFGRQLALLQKQREELIDKLKDRERDNYSLSEAIGEKGILEETLRKEKDVLVAKLKEKEKIEKELSDKKVLLEKQAAKQKELEDIVYQKDMNEIELMKQKRILEENLREIESRFRDKEENLDFEKNKLLNELREKRTKDTRSRFSESDDEVSSVCSESATHSDRNIGRLKIMLEQVEKQHSVAVNVLRDQLRLNYNKRERELRREHRDGLEQLAKDSRNQLESLRGQYENQLDSLRTEIERSRERRNSKEDDGSGGEGQSSDLSQQYKKVKEELSRSLPSDQKDKLDSLVASMDEQYQAQLEDMHRQHVDDVDEQVKSMRSTLDEIYTSQLEIVRSEMEQSHKTAMLDLQKDHKEEMNRIEQEYSIELEQLKQDYEAELKENKKGQAIGKEDSESFISQLNKKLTEEHRQIIQKIEADLDTSITHHHSQDSQTEGEETVSVASEPVTKSEYKHVAEKHGVLAKAEDAQKSLDKQVEEISALRARMLGEYEQMLSVRAEVMASQSEEVSKLQEEMAQIQQQYENQMAEFQSKVQSQTETALKSAHEQELEKMKQYYETKVSDMEESYTTDIARLKQEHAEFIARLQQESGTAVEIPSPQSLSAGQHREYVRRTTTLTAISDEDMTPESTPPGGNEILEGRIRVLEEKLKDKEKLVKELKGRLEAEATSAEDLHGKLLDSNKTLDDFEESLKSKSDEIEELKKLLLSKDEKISELESEKAALEEKGEKDRSESGGEESKIISELKERIKKLEEDLSASKEANARIQQELNDLDSQHGEAIMRLKEEMEILNKAKIDEIEAGFQIQLEEELKQQADELDSKYREELSRQTTEELEMYKRTEIDLRQKLNSLQKEHESQIKELKEKYGSGLTSNEIQEGKMSETQMSSSSETLDRDSLEASLRKDLESKVLQEYEQSIDKLKSEYEERISDMNARLKTFEKQDVEKAEVSDREKDESDTEQKMKEKLKAELALEFKDKLQSVTDEYESKLKKLQDIVDSKKEMKSPTHSAPYALSRSRSLDLMPQKEKEKTKTQVENEGYVTAIRREYEDKINSLQMQIAQYRSTVGSVPSSPLSTLQKSQVELATGDSHDKVEIEPTSIDSVQVKSKLGTPELRQEIYEEIASEFEASFKGLRANYEKQLEELTAKLELLQSDGGSYENKIREEIAKEYEAKIEKLKQEYETQISELKSEHATEVEKLNEDVEKAKSEVKTAQQKVKTDMFVWHEEIVTQLKRKHEEYESQLRKEYEEKMELFREELQEGFDAEKDIMIRNHKQELIDLEDRYDNLVEGLRTGEVPEVAELVQEKFDMELEMAKTLIQQECDETIEAEQTRLSEQFESQMKEVLVERDREQENQRLHYEKEMADLRNTLLQQYESQVVELESQHKAEIIKLKAAYEKLMQDTEVEEETVEKETVSRAKAVFPQGSVESTKTEEGDKDEESEKVTSLDSTDKSDKDDEDDDDDKGDGKGGALAKQGPSQSPDIGEKHEQERESYDDKTEERDEVDNSQEEVSETMIKEVKVVKENTALLKMQADKSQHTGEDSALVDQIREELAAKIVEYESSIAQMRLLHEEEVRQLTEQLSEAEAQYQQTVAELEESHEREVKNYQDTIEKLREGLSDDDDDDSEALELAHQQELQDLEERLLQKHMNELNNLETQHQSRLDDMADKYKIQIEELRKEVVEAQRALEQYPDAASPTQTVPVFHGGSTMGSTKESMEDFMVPTGSSRTESEKSESHGATMETQIFEARSGEDRSEEEASQGVSLAETLEEVGVQSLDTSVIDTSMDQSRGTLRGVDTTQDTELIQFSEEEESEKSMEEDVETQKSGRSTPVALMQTLGYGAEIPGGPTVKSLDDTTDSSIRASDREEMASRIKELETEVDELQGRLKAELSKQDAQMERMDREKQEESNLTAMLRGDIERLNSDRDALQSTNEHLLGLLSDAVKTYMGVEESITKKMKVMMEKSGDKLTVDKGQPGAVERKRTPPPGRRSPATSPGRLSPSRAEDGEAADTSIVSNVTDEGLDLSQHISDSIFQGPELKSEEEELLIDSGSRLRSSVNHLLEIMEETTSQLLETRQSQSDAMDTLEGRGHDLEQLTSRCNDLEERLKEEVERKDFLALELHKAEGLIEGYSSERESLDERIHELEEHKETLVLELQTTRNKLLDLESVQTENLQLKKEMDEQRELMTHNVGEEAQGFNRYQYVIVPIGVAIGCLFLHDLLSR